MYIYIHRVNPVATPDGPPNQPGAARRCQKMNRINPSYMHIYIIYICIHTYIHICIYRETDRYIYR